jgi:hypothetical protein
LPKMFRNGLLFSFPASQFAVRIIYAIFARFLRGFGESSKGAAWTSSMIYVIKATCC